MFNLFNRSVPPHRLPRLTIAQRVIDKIVANALIYETETGESLVGLVMRSQGRQEPDLYVLDTIAPENAVRMGAYFEQGEPWQEKVFNWLHDNWEQMRESRRSIYTTAEGAKFDSPLAHLGNWHKHPGTLTEPSWGDADTARDDLNDTEAGSPQIVVMLATVWSGYEALADSPAPAVVSTTDPVSQDGAVAPEDEEPYDPPIEPSEPHPIRIRVSDVTTVRIDCWYMSRNIRRFVRLNPVIVPDIEVPSLPIIGWHIQNPERFAEELDVLERAGYAVKVKELDTDRVPPREICFSLARRTSQNVIIVVTQADYPATMPNIRLTPMSVIKTMPEHVNVFDFLWNGSQPLPQLSYPLWAWTPDKRLIDLVHDIEAKLEGTAQS